MMVVAELAYRRTHWLRAGLQSDEVEFGYRSRGCYEEMTESPLAYARLSKYLHQSIEEEIREFLAKSASSNTFLLNRSFRSSNIIV